MEIKCGTDIIEVERIKNSIETLGDNFLNKIYTKKEIEYCNSKNNMKYQHFAGRFAAKEAFFKAVSTFLDNKYDISWQDMQVVNDENGKPIVEILNVSLPQIESIDISISHLKDYAIANCTLICK